MVLEQSGAVNSCSLMLYDSVGQTMKPTLIFVLLLACVSGPASLGQEPPVPREAKPEEIPFVYDSKFFTKVRIQDVARAKAADLDNFPEDAPAHSCFHLESSHELPALDQGPRYFYPAYTLICIIPLKDTSVTSYAKAYPTVNKAARQLRVVLKNRPRKFRFWHELTDLPYNNASGAILSRVEYLPFKTGKGVLFLTQYSQDLYPSPINNEELTAVFQGLSDDGKYYVAARLAITHPSLPRGIDFTPDISRDKARSYLRKAEQDLNRLDEESFTPSLKMVKAMISSISTN